MGPWRSFRYVRVGSGFTWSECPLGRQNGTRSSRRRMSLSVPAPDRGAMIAAVRSGGVALFIFALGCGGQPTAPSAPVPEFPPPPFSVPTHPIPTGLAVVEIVGVTGSGDPSVTEAMLCRPLWLPRGGTSLRFYVDVAANGNGGWSATATAPTDTIRFDLERTGTTVGGNMLVSGAISGSARDREVSPFHSVRDVRFETASESGTAQMHGRTIGGSTVVGEIVGRFSLTDSDGVGSTCGFAAWIMNRHSPQNAPLER